MTELWDILDENGEKTGRTVLRGEAMQPGEYYLAVHIWIRNSAGEYLIQKRTPDKPLWPGMWAATGGAAVAGETSVDSALRELEEELGIRAEAGELRFVRRLKSKDWFTDIWLMERDIVLEEIRMQPEEVCGVLWATKGRIREMAEKKEFVQFSYLDGIYDSSLFGF